MSIKNKVTANFPEITVYDSAGNILGLSIPATINATGSNIGSFIVSANTQVGALSTAIGNGNLRTGANLYVGVGQVLNIDTSVGNVVNVFTTGTYNDVTVQLAAKGAANIELLSNALFTGNVVQGNSVSAGSSLHTLYSSINATAANVGAFRVGNAGNVNITTAIGNGNILTGGTTLTLGTTTTVAPTFTINSANAQNSTIALAKAGTTRYSIVADSTSNIGNLNITALGANALRIIAGDGNTSNITLTTTASSQSYQLRRSSQNLNAGDNKISFDITDSNSIPYFTYSSGTFTNTGPARKFVFTLTTAVATQGTRISEIDLWFQYNSPSTVSSTARRAQQAWNSSTVTIGANSYTANTTSQLMSTTFPVVLNTNDTMTCWVYADQNYTIGSAIYGFSANYSCQINVIEVL